MSYTSTPDVRFIAQDRPCFPYKKRLDVTYPGNKLEAAGGGKPLLSNFVSRCPNCGKTNVTVFQVVDDFALCNICIFPGRGVYRVEAEFAMAEEPVSALLVPAQSPVEAVHYVRLNVRPSSFPPKIKKVQQVL